jgi:hypothetical protein
LAEETGTKSIAVVWEKLLDKLQATNTAVYIQSLQQTIIGNADMNTCIRFRKTLRKLLEKETK